MTILAFLPCPMWLADRPLVGIENLWVKDHKGSLSEVIYKEVGRVYRIPLILMHIAVNPRCRIPLG